MASGISSRQVDGSESSADYYHRLWSDDWLWIAGGIVRAAFAYPIVLAALTVAFGLAAAVIGLVPPGVGVVAARLEAIIPLALVTPVAGIGAAIINTVATPILHGMLRTVRLQPRIEWFGAFKGGLVGFAATSPTLFFVPVWDSLDAASVVPILAGPCLATIIGQVGGACGGRNAGWYKRAVLNYEVPRACDAMAGVELGDHHSPDQEQDGLRSDIRQMLWVTAWVSVLLTIVRFTGRPFLQTLLVLCIWLVFQSATLWLGARLVRRLGPWWLRHRQGRST